MALTGMVVVRGQLVGDVVQVQFLLYLDCPEDEMERRLLARNRGDDDNVETIRKRWGRGCGGWWGEEGGEREGLADKGGGKGHAWLRIYLMVWVLHLMLWVLHLMVWVLLLCRFKSLLVDTQPVVDDFEAQGKVRRVDAGRPIGE